MQEKKQFGAPLDAQNPFADNQTWNSEQLRAAQEKFSAQFKHRMLLDSVRASFRFSPQGRLRLTLAVLFAMSWACGISLPSGEVDAPQIPTQDYGDQNAPIVGPIIGLVEEKANEVVEDANNALDHAEWEADQALTGYEEPRSHEYIAGGDAVKISVSGGDFIRVVFPTGFGDFRVSSLEAHMWTVDASGNVVQRIPADANGGGIVVTGGTVLELTPASVLGEPTVLHETLIINPLDPSKNITFVTQRKQ